MARGWVQIYGEDLVRTVRESGVPYDGMVMKQNTYVPRWVYDAIQNFQKNGYADMTLAEFLKKLKP